MQIHAGNPDFVIVEVYREIESGGSCIDVSEDGDVQENPAGHGLSVAVSLGACDHLSVPLDLVSVEAGGGTAVTVRFLSYVFACAVIFARARIHEDQGPDNAEFVSVDLDDVHHVVSQ